MKKFYLSCLLLALVTGVFSQNNRPMNKDDYKSEWLKVAQFEKQSLPKSAAEAVNNILRRAVADENGPQIIKAIIHQGKYDLVLDSHNDTLIFANLNEMVKKSANEVELAVLHSMLGELYLEYYQKDRWNIGQRTPLGDMVPADMKEWTSNIFFNKVVEHLNASLQNKKVLLDTDVEVYGAVVEKGEDGKRFYPSMFDFLLRRAIELSGQIDTDEDLGRLLARKKISQASLFAPTAEFVRLSFDPQMNESALWTLEYYRQHLQSLQERGMRPSILLTELDRLNYLSRFDNAHAVHALPLLEKMREEWKGDPMSVEIVDRIAGLRIREIEQLNEEDSVLTKKKTGELYELLSTNITAFPKYERIAILQNRLAQLTQPQFTVTGANTFSKDGDKVLKVNFKNLQSLKAKLYRINSPMEMLEGKNNPSKSNNQQRSWVNDVTVILPKIEAYWEGETSFSVNPGGYGSFVLVFESSPGEEKRAGRNTEYYFSVTDLAVFARASGEKTYDFFVVDRNTGNPVKNTRVDIYKLPQNWRTSRLALDQTVATNELGLAVYEKKIPNYDVYYHAVVGEDKGAALTRLPSGNYSFSEKAEKAAETLDIFTDRSLYRPGQVVYFKAVLSLADGGERKALDNQSVVLVLRDANYRDLAEQTLTTNSFGSVAGEFILPKGVLGGQFSIEAKRSGGAAGYLNFRVEEYKRPTFEVTFNKIEDSYRFGEEIKLKGKAMGFSGISLQQANVEYVINRRSVWWRMWGGGTAQHYLSGNVTTDNDGGFEIAFVPEKPESQGAANGVYMFEVEVTVTDLNGETQQALYTVTVGDQSMVLSLDMPDRWIKEKKEKNIVIKANNLDGNEVAANGTYRLFSLNDNDSIKATVLQGEFKTGEQSSLREELTALPSGKYRFKLTAKDDRGNRVETEKDVLVFAYADKRPPIKTNNWFIEKNNRFSPGKNAEVILGASGKISVLHELWQGVKLLERKWVTIDNENRLILIPHQAQYGDGVTLMLTYVKDEKFYAHKVDILPVEEKNDLKISLDVFRDKIRPGSEEEWRISVTGTDGSPVMAEVLASMYDFSLDNIYPSQDWTFTRLSSQRYFSPMTLNNDQSFASTMAVGNLSSLWKKVTPFAFDRFNWYGYSLYNSRRMMFRSSAAGAVLQEVAESAMDFSDNMDLSAKVVEQEFSPAFDAVAANSAPMGKQEEKESAQVRQNFNETAFFFPHLTTNEKGETLIAFTVPESNTRWRFRLLAHDKMLHSAKAEAFSVSQKELMVTPNIPRFLRHGDKASLSTKISNLSDGAITGVVTLEFFNPLTEETIRAIQIEGAEQSFSLEKDASSDVRWTFDVPANIDLMGMRVVARSAQFSDGEQHAVAVLPNRTLVTESMRMDLEGSQTKEFTMERMRNRTSATIEDYRLTLEFASSPAWYAVQALPVLSEPESDNAVSWFATFYANTLGTHIGKAFPKVKAMVDAWQKQGGDKNGFISNLEKNQELKEVLLEETPWVLEAKNETEQKQRLALLFDLNRSRGLTATAVDRLLDLQTNRGGWSWFKGFAPSVGITQYILYGFQQLKELGAAEFPENVVAMQDRAVEYIDAEALDRFENLKKYDKNWKSIKSISLTDLEYLFVRSAYKQLPMDNEVKKMADFYLSVVEKNWTNYQLYERSLISQLMHRHAKSTVEAAILKSFREHASHSEEMGTYWANNRAQVFMSQSAVSVHTFIMDAFRAGGADTKEMDAMKRWLLKQKQTQLWETTHATADAVYALLSDGSDWFSDEAETVVYVGGKEVKPESREKGSGYFKESWSREAIAPVMAEVKVEHRGTGPAWGALYWQYFEEMDKVEKNDGSLDIEKQLFLEQSTSAGTQLVRITDQNPLKVGDKVVVRLTIRSDRDLEFVHLKDMRAAAFEPVSQLSGMDWQNGVPYYRTSKDASTSFYFNTLPKGTYVVAYSLYVTRSGSYSNGITSIQCMYAPEFTSHSEGMRIFVKE